MAAKAPFVELFKGADGRWYGHVKARNGRITATAGQGYHRKAGVQAWASRQYPDLAVKVI